MAVDFFLPLGYFSLCQDVIAVGIDWLTCIAKSPLIRESGQDGWIFLSVYWEPRPAVNLFQANQCVFHT